MKLVLCSIAAVFDWQNFGMLQDVCTRKEGTVDAAFGLIDSLTRNTRALSISPSQGTLHSLFAIFDQ